MCGRYFFDLASEELKEYYEQAVLNEDSQDIKVGLNEIFPSNNVVTLGINKKEAIVPGITRWGFEGFKKGQLIINARAETVEEKKTFAQPFIETRCVFPMSGFYEWDASKQKFFFTNSDKTVIYVGGFYRIRKNSLRLETESVILTTKPNSSVAPIHDRMPLLLEKAQIKKWLTDLDFARKHLASEMPELIQTDGSK